MRESEGSIKICIFSSTNNYLYTLYTRLEMVVQSQELAESTAKWPRKLYAGNEYAVLFQGGPLNVQASNCCQAKPLVLVDKESVLSIHPESISPEPLPSGYGLWSANVEIADHLFGGIITSVIEYLPTGTGFEVNRNAYEQAYRQSKFITLGTAYRAFPEAVERLEEITHRELDRMKAVRLVKERLGNDLKIGKEEYLVYFNYTPTNEPFFQYRLWGKYRGRQLKCSSYLNAQQPVIEIRFKELVSGVGRDLLFDLVGRLKQQCPNIYYDENTDDERGRITFFIVYEKKRVSKKSLQSLPRVLEKIEQEIAKAKVRIRKVERVVEKEMER